MGQVNFYFKNEIAIKCETLYFACQAIVSVHDLVAKAMKNKAGRFVDYPLVFSLESLPCPLTHLFSFPPPVSILFMNFAFFICLLYVSGFSNCEVKSEEKQLHDPIFAYRSYQHIR